MAIQRYLLTILASLVLVPPVIGAICDSTISDVIGIASQTDADDIAGCGSANADIEISEDYTGALILNGITKTTRSLIFQGVTNLTSFAAPDLLVIDGNLTLASCILLTDLTLGELNFVGDMKLEDLPNLQSLNFTSGMRTVSGISIVNTGLTTLDGLEISSASDGINISANTALTDITFPSLTNTSIFSIHANNPKMKVNLPSLAAVQDLTIENVTSLSIPGLYQVTGQLLIAGSSIDSFSTGPLKNGGDILFIDNPFLSNISMPDLTSLSGDLVITGNEALQQITGFTGLADVQGNIDVTGNYTG
ncbi:GPI-anchored cell wall organization protein [Talaromyces pinophilus]|uniref:GPI-anchored cell wall organization protein n=1 Tax=Talaromyces pinophilus TaxID=128442 RepID=A0A6V8H9G4_TALPI|nr:GPI-anchored cell wall organization protein [Talaromyces pinophilus]